jgi:hypothetical protein
MVGGPVNQYIKKHVALNVFLFARNWSKYLVPGSAILDYMNWNTLSLIIFQWNRTNDYNRKDPP